MFDPNYRPSDNVFYEIGITQGIRMDTVPSHIQDKLYETLYKQGNEKLWEHLSKLTYPKPTGSIRTMPQEEMVEYAMQAAEENPYLTTYLLTIFDMVKMYVAGDENVMSAGYIFNDDKTLSIIDKCDKKKAQKTIQAI